MKIIVFQDTIFESRNLATEGSLVRNPLWAFQSYVLQVQVHKEKGM